MHTLLSMLNGQKGKHWLYKDDICETGLVLRVQGRDLLQSWQALVHASILLL